jgi:F-type H+-transporting ATPase subunit b
LPKVGRVIDEREGRVAGDLDAAEAAKAEADAIRTRYDTGMASARDTAQARVAEAQTAAAKAAEVRMKALADVLDGKAADAATRLSGARDTARAALAATTTELTAEAVTRLTGLTLPAAEIEAVLSAQK